MNRHCWKKTYEREGSAGILSLDFTSEKVAVLTVLVRALLDVTLTLGPARAREC